MEGTNYELPPSIASIPMGIALGSGATFPAGNMQEFLDDVSGENDPYTNNSNAFGRIFHDASLALGDSLGAGTTVITEEFFEHPAPGWGINGGQPLSFPEALPQSDGFSAARGWSGYVPGGGQEYRGPWVEPPWLADNPDYVTPLKLAA
ncbi:hypothetical protein [uncultured Pelagimonas sp.]|uniref:hypothetical protein n=1 Tax=uncultured Pelagimonas sp. TaxID=1618102 RepID=UPI002614B46B|nr:hypothetical protein [uncultured Pelagimonas sp.]